jgi:hypothetical protein
MELEANHMAKPLNMEFDFWMDDECHLKAASPSA